MGPLSKAIAICTVVIPVASGVVIGVAETARRRYYNLQDETERTITARTPYGAFLLLVGGLAAMPALVLATTVGLFIGSVKMK